MKWVKCLILVGFDDMGYDKWFEMGKLGFCLILVGILKIRNKVEFLSWCVDESAIGFAAFPGCLFSFCHPHTQQNYGISPFFRGINNRTNVR